MFNKVHPCHASYICENAACDLWVSSLGFEMGELASHVEKNESTAAKDGEDRSSHEEESEAVEEDMWEVFMGETRCYDGPSNSVWIRC